ncbi:MAG TPA: hypothetical protein VGD60_11430 [Candidatus Acidoferrales bacterium]
MAKPRTEGLKKFTINLPLSEVESIKAQLAADGQGQTFADYTRYALKLARTHTFGWDLTSRVMVLDISPNDRHALLNYATKHGTTAEAMIEEWIRDWARVDFGEQAERSARRNAATPTLAGAATSPLSDVPAEGEPISEQSPAGAEQALVSAAGIGETEDAAVPLPVARRQGPTGPPFAPDFRGSAQ